MNPESLTWRLLTAEELTNVYLNEMRRDFPAGELKPLSMILNSEAAGTAHTWGVYEDDALVAYLLMVRPVGCEVSQLDYFAVLPQYRAGGIGAPRKSGGRGYGRAPPGLLRPVRGQGHRLDRASL